jgi:hypothetical protein
VVAKELHTMEEMIGEELGGRLAKATPACLRNDGWVPPAWAAERLDGFSPGVAA